MSRITLSLLIGAALAVAFQPSRSAAAERDRVDQSIDRALAFLKSMQDSDGAWRHGSEKSPAMTSLAVLAFLSAGHVPGEGPYGANVEKGVRWVLNAQGKNGLMAGSNYQEMYHQGISTLMLAEAAGMTGDKLARELKPKLEKAVQLILKAQRTAGQHRGGWRYQVFGQDADISVSGWQLLALRAARNLGCDVPQERIQMAVEYVQRCRDPGSGGFCYMPGSGVTVACTGTCILCLELCGKERHGRETLQAGSYLLKQHLTWNQPYFFYTVYYGSQAMFQLGNNYWNFYRPQLHKVLLDNQQANGSWVGGEGFGPNYGTAMSILALTVEYRFLPIYQRGEDSAERK